MATFFFDTSALVKRYMNETGLAWVVQITDPAAGNQIHVARISGVEMVSAITRQAQGGHLSMNEAAAALTDFRNDFANQYRIVAITPRLLARAMILAEAHALRGYDAVQLAAALHLHVQCLSRHRPALTLVSADMELNAAATAEGLVVEDPNTHP